MMRLLRKLPMFAALLGFVAAFVWMDNDKLFRRESFPPFSLHNIAEKGTSLAYRYQKESRAPKSPAANELNRRIEFAELEPNAVVLRIAPEFKPGEREKDSSAKPGAKPAPSTGAPTPKPPTDGPLLSDGERKWVEKGGRLVLALSNNYGPVQVEDLARTETIEKTLAIWPHVNQLLPKPHRILKLKGAALENAVAIFIMTDELFAVRMPVGDGDVIVLASPECLTNNYLGETDNLRLLLELAPLSRPVYFDEFVHGLKGAPGTGELLMRWGMGMALLMMTAGSLMLFWRERTPIGPPEDDHKETRTQAIDFVNALAPLYNRALEPHQAIALYYKNFVHAVTVQSGLRGAELHERIFKLLDMTKEDGLAGKRPLSPPEFFSLLKTLNDAYGRLERAHRR